MCSHRKMRWNSGWPSSQKSAAVVPTSLQRPVMTKISLSLLLQSTGNIVFKTSRHTTEVGREETNPAFTSMTLFPVVVFYMPGQILIFLAVVLYIHPDAIKEKKKKTTE